MGKTLILLSWLSSLTFSLAQSPGDLWIHTYGGSKAEYGNAVLSTNDGGNIFVGSAASTNGAVLGLHNPSGSNSDFWVVKLDGNGVIQWQKCLGGSKNEVAYEIIQVADGGYVIVGAAVSNDGDVTWHYGSDSFNDLWIVKLDNSGNLLWQKTYGGYSEEYACSVSETSDGGLVVAAILNADYNGTVPITHNGSLDYWVLKLNAIGEMQWNKNYGGENGDHARSIKSTPDGGCIVVGQSGSHYGDVINSVGPMNADIPDFWIVKLSTTSTIEWQKSFGGLQGDWATSISLTNDGGYIIAGNTSSANNGNVTNFHGATDGWVIKIDSSGNLQWQKCVGGTGLDYFYSVIQTIDGGFLICGNTDSYDGDLAGTAVGNKAWIVKLDSNGTLSWQKHYRQQPIYNSFNDITQNPDGTCVAVGYLNQPSDYDNYDVFTVKLDVNSNTLSNSEFNNLGVVLYPNPVNDLLHIQSDEVLREINIFDMLGKKIISFYPENNSVDLRSLQSGIYFIELINDKNEIVRKKIIKN